MLMLVIGGPVFALLNKSLNVLRIIYLQLARCPNIILTGGSNHWCLYILQIDRSSVWVWIIYEPMVIDQAWFENLMSFNSMFELSVSQEESISNEF